MVGNLAANAQIVHSLMLEQDAERLESAKAGAVAAAGGLLGSLPFLATLGQGSASALLSAAQIFASCFLFGVTFRYVHHADPYNVQLKLGTVAAFGLVSRPPSNHLRAGTCKRDFRFLLNVVLYNIALFGSDS
jgi:hypothetical protein